jgi:glycosyltransferase involved in cell wall biosynthesis
MDRNLIYACMLSHQCLELDYPIEASIRCALDLCDVVMINDGKSTDGTLDLLYKLQDEFGSDRLLVFEKVWRHDRSLWAAQRNFLIDLVEPKDYIFAIDADELIHEDDFSKIRQFTDRGVGVLSFPVVHFYGRPTHYIQGSAWYNRHTRLWRKNTGIKIVQRPGGCADDVLWPDGYAAHLGRYVDSAVTIYHYGNCRDPRALGRKSKKADDLYQNSEAYLDGSLSADLSFDYAFEKSGAKIFTGAHPKYINQWYDMHKEQDTTYLIGGKIKKLWCFE